MRGGRSFLILLVVALGIGAYAYFVESKHDTSDTASTPKPTKVFTIDASKVEEIEVKAASGEVTKLKKTGNDWQIVAPEPMEADQQTVSSLVSSVESLETSKTIDEKPASVKEYGLDPPQVSVGVRLAGETAMHRIQIGEKTVTGADVYARVEGQPKLFLVGSSVNDSLNRTPFDLREKSVLKFDHDKADSLKLEPTGAPAVSLVKKANDWRLGAPADAKADFGTVDGIIGRLSQAKMKALTASDGTSELKKYGLDKPQAVATVGAGLTRASLAIGTKLDDGSFYARDLSRPMVFTVEATVLDDLKKKADDLRSKDLFEFRSFTAMSVDITHGAETVGFAKQKAAQPAQPNASSVPTETWKQTKPAAKDVDQAKLNDLLTNLSNLRADKFAEKPLASGDEYVVVARFGEDASPKEERVTFRKSGDVVQAIRQGESGAAIVPTAEFDKVVAGLKEITGAK